MRKPGRPRGKGGNGSDGDCISERNASLFNDWRRMLSEGLDRHIARLQLACNYGIGYADVALAISQERRKRKIED